uniref:Uncharacterized protein n=1 Tax=Arion vulgaris TaxID=1028688 RepID=A0A0B6ZRL8_9EUPU
MAKKNCKQTVNYIDNVFPYTFPWLGSVTFTGGLRDYRSHLIGHTQAVGIGDTSNEQTLDTGYLFRSAPGTPMGRPRSLIPGEIGWGIPWLVDEDMSKTGHQIIQGYFRQAAEDKIAHGKINAWYPGPKDYKHGAHGNNQDNSYSETSDASQGGSQHGIYSHGRFRPLEATQHLDMHTQ